MTTLLAHEWLAPVGGSENVFEELSITLPDARRMCLWNDAPERFGTDIEQTWIAGSPLRRSKALAYPFLSSAWKRINLSGVDRVVVSTHASAHYLASRAANAGVPSYAYVHTPPRYVWAAEFDERGQSPLARLGRGFFKRHDRRLTSPDVAFAANSEFVRDRIRHSWGVDAAVIYPPVDVTTLQSVADWRTEVANDEELRKLEALPAHFVLGASRLIEYKRLDAVIEIAEALGVPAVLAGSGPYERELRALATSRRVPVVFFGYASSPALYALYQAATAFVFMAVEDFGIMPVEAMSLGTPAIVSAVGGARESVESIEGGLVIEGGDYTGLADDLGRLDLNMERMVARARAFSAESFRRNVRTWLSGEDVGAFG